MSPRTGRPKSDNPRDIDIKVRIDKGTNDTLLQYCIEHNITRAEAIRQGINLILVQKRNNDNVNRRK